jgi:hypothetical protein
MLAKEVRQQKTGKAQPQVAKWVILGGPYSGVVHWGAVVGSWRRRWRRMHRVAAGGQSPLGCCARTRLSIWLLRLPTEAGRGP